MEFLVFVTKYTAENLLTTITADDNKARDLKYDKVAKNCLKIDAVKCSILKLLSFFIEMNSRLSFFRAQVLDRDHMNSEKIKMRLY
jgi:hypothetical protein